MNQQYRDRTFSCEFFPPSTAKGMTNLLRTKDSLEQTMSPAFFSVTFGAGGSNRDRTLETVNTLRADGVAQVAPHISCMGSTQQQLDDLLQTYIDSGIERLVTLRGDLPVDGSASGDFSYASELVTHIRDTTGDHFHIEVAAYPEYHPESASPADDFSHFADKVKAGADSAITQYFYNIDAYSRLVEKCEAAGLGIQLVPGIMPITSFTNLARFSDRCGAEIPRWIRKNLEAWQDDKDSLLEFGTEVVSNLCQQLLADDAPGLHFYTLNQSAATLAIWNRLFA
jgi:methylenetetrahydrofolate reductase (NADPH)